METLEAEGWFERGHDIQGSSTNCDGMWIPSYEAGSFIWVPPPGVARFAVEELRQARLKRQRSFHVVIVPRLNTPEFRKQLYKSSDCMFELPAGHSLWPKDMHEPLLIALYFPYLNRCPWELRKTRLMVDVGRKMQRLLKTDEGAGRDLLSELCLLASRFDTMSLRDLRAVLSGRWKPLKVPSSTSV